MFSLFAKKVKVTFINNTNGELIGISKMKPEQLPESFDRPTTMHLQEEEWTVAKADPVSRKEFAICGNLTLHLNPIERIDPEKVLFTIATIPDLLRTGLRSRSASNVYYGTLEGDIIKELVLATDLIA